MSWLVGRCGPGDLTPERLAEMKAWVESLGVDPARMRLCAAVTQDEDTYHLHLSELQEGDGHTYALDVAARDVVAAPMVVEVAENSWPAWLTGMGNKAGKRRRRDPA